MGSDTRDVLATAGQQLEAILRQHLAGATEVALLDAPNHDNVGDSLIWLGTVETLRRLGVTVRYATDFARFDAAAVRRLGDHVPILCLGGGNFGDIWPWSETFRRDVVRSFPDRRILILPQSIHYGSAEERAVTAEIMRRHRDLVVLVRDRPSLEAATAMGLDCHLCPDAAFGIDVARWARRPRRGPRHDVVALWRTDREVARTAGATVPSDAVVMDWPRPRNRVRHAAQRALGIGARIGRFDRLILPGSRAIYDALARREVRRGFRMLGSGRVVVTDRLHATVMALMLDMPVVRVDNFYGKIDAVLSACWPEGLGYRRAETRRDALEIAGEWTRPGGWPEGLGQQRAESRRDALEIAGESARRGGPSAH